ncbi:MAG: 3-keto-5-aminohexanoate cleavage protein [Lachnospiraceae bacterium]|nr:3-keto-5-aminohexanoate cleavage protein [Lachnospiraceae bacterium]
MFENKIMLSVAPVSAADTHIDPDAIAKDVVECYHNGASMVHLHVRDAHGKLTPDLTLLAETVEKIRSECDIVVEISTGGVSNLTIEERIKPLYAPYTEAASLNVGSVNLGDAVYQNPIKDVRLCVQEIIAQKKIPEIEVFELGMIHTVKELDEQFHFVRPILFALVFGHGGEMPATLPALRHMVDFLYETFPKDEVLWGYTQAYRTDFEMVKKALDMGTKSLRLGFEDSDYLENGERAKTNAPLIASAASLIREKGKDLMTPDEVRSMLKIIS